MEEIVPTEEPLRTAVLVGSIRPGRFGPTPSAWIAEQVRQHDVLEADLIDLGTIELQHELRDFADPMPTAVGELIERLEAAEAFVVITPEYNHSFPAGLKTAIDWAGGAWQAKPVAFVSYGGLAGGLRAVEHLRQVFAETHAVTVRDTVSFHNFWDKFDEEGNPVDEGASVAAKTMLDQLAWWGLTLREGRAARTYGG